MPPRQAIASWIQAKGIVPRAINGKLPTTEQLSFLIARKIGRDGIAPTNTLEKTLQGIQPHVEDKLMIAVKADIEDNITEFIKI